MKSRKDQYTQHRLGSDRHKWNNKKYTIDLPVNSSLFADDRTIYISGKDIKIIFFNDPKHAE